MFWYGPGPQRLRADPGRSGRGRPPADGVGLRRAFASVRADAWLLAALVAPPCTPSSTSGFSCRPSSAVRQPGRHQSHAARTDPPLHAQACYHRRRCWPDAVPPCASSEHQPPAHRLLREGPFRAARVEVQPALDVTQRPRLLQVGAGGRVPLRAMALTRAGSSASCPGRATRRSRHVLHRDRGARRHGRKTPEITGTVAKSDESCPSGAGSRTPAGRGRARLGSGTSRSKPKDFSGVDKVLREERRRARRARRRETPPARLGSVARASRRHTLRRRSAALRPVRRVRRRGAAGVFDRPEDIVKVTVLGHDDLTQTIVVQSDGTFIYPLIGASRPATSRRRSWSARSRRCWPRASCATRR
jgi:hypothetical protein